MALWQVVEQFSDIAKPIIIKSDVLRLGIKFSENTKKMFKNNNELLYKGYFLFSYDRNDPVVYNQKIPFRFIIEDGSSDGTVVQVRTAEQTPYLIEYIDENFKLLYESQELYTVHFDIMPRYYRRHLEGVPMASLVQAGRDLLFVTANKHCEYFNQRKQCLYCDLTHQAATQKRGGEVVVLRKQAEQVAEALEIALHESRFRHIFITGGTILTKYQEKAELEWYTEFLDTIRQRLRVWYPTSFQIAALDDDGWRRIKETGVSTVQPNIEVWGESLFQTLCPGKAEQVGFNEWVKRTIRAVDFFGPGNVNPNFVSGVEMAQPFGYRDPVEAAGATLKGYDFLMSNGVLPRQGDFWCIEQNSMLAGQNPPPLEYYLLLGQGYLELREKHGFITPPVTMCRRCLPHGTEYDFEYWHGTGPSSKDAELQSQLDAS